MADHDLEHPCYAVISSRRGASHDRDGSDRQDRALIVDLSGDLLIVMADGVGSASRGADAADLAVRVAVRVIRDARGHGDGLLRVDDGTAEERLEFRTTRVRRVGEDPPTEGGDTAPAGVADWRAAITSALVAAREVVLHQAAQSGDDRHAWATTLTVAVVTEQDVHAGQIGDGFVVLWNGDAVAQSQVLAHRAVADEAPDHVTAITSSAAPHELTYGQALFGPDAHLLVSTDGIAPVLLDQWFPPRASPRFLSGLGRELASGRLDAARLDALLDSQLICSRSDDDKSVVLVRRHPLGKSSLPAGRHRLDLAGDDESTGQSAAEAPDAPAAVPSPGFGPVSPYAASSHDLA